MPVLPLSANEFCKAKGFVKQMMTVDPVERINIHQVGGLVGDVETTDPFVNFGRGKLQNWTCISVPLGDLHWAPVSCISMLDLT